MFYINLVKNVKDKKVRGIEYILSKWQLTVIIYPQHIKG